MLFPVGDTVAPNGENWNITQFEPLLTFVRAEYVSFIALPAQAHHLVNSLVEGKVPHAAMYLEARDSAARVAATQPGGTEQMFFLAIVNDLRQRSRQTDSTKACKRLTGDLERCSYPLHNAASRAVRGTN
jgi:hypothetical protein